MSKKKDQNFLVTVWDASGIYLDAPMNYIIMAKDEQEAEAILKETDPDEFQNYYIVVEPLTNIKRLSRLFKRLWILFQITADLKRVLNFLKR